MQLLSSCSARNTRREKLLSAVSSAVSGRLTIKDACQLEGLPGALEYINTFCVNSAVYFHHTSWSADLSMKGIRLCAKHNQMQKAFSSSLLIEKSSSNERS